MQRTGGERGVGARVLRRELARGLLDGFAEIVVVGTVVAVVLGGAGLVGYLIGDVGGAVVGTLTGLAVLAVGWVVLVVTGARDALRRWGPSRR